MDCVLVVPAFWGPPQRQAYIDAAKLAGGWVGFSFRLWCWSCLPFGGPHSAKPTSMPPSWQECEMYPALRVITEVSVAWYDRHLETAAWLSECPGGIFW